MNDYEKAMRLLRRMDRIVSGIITLLVLIATVIVAVPFYDMYRTSRAGVDTVEYRDFESLLQINGDTVAWLSMDGTHIDHPVVQADDNFFYLDKDFYGKDYAGGTLFLDADDDPAMQGEYHLIHGHHMAHGAMFGDLEKYLDGEFFEKNTSGQLLTRGTEYDLLVVGAGTVDAYDSAVYRMTRGRTAPRQKLDEWENAREMEWEVGDKMLALSTCSGEMNDSRTVVFCRMRERVTNG